MKFVLLLPLLFGCAYNRPHLVETVTVMTNGVVVTQREVTMRSFVLWPATSTLDKQRATIGKTMGVGTEGLGQESSGTNSVELLREFRLSLDALNKLKSP